MNQIETACKVPVYEVNGEDAKSNETITVKTHWTRENMVTIKVGSKSVTVVADDLISAVNRCSQ